MDNLNRLLKTLTDGEIDFVLIGGFAALLFGSSQVTKDIDVCVSLTPEHIDQLRKCLAPLHPKHRMTQKKLSFLEFPEDLRGLKNLYVQTDLGILDILGEVTNVGSFEEIKKRAAEISLYGKKVKVIAVDDLIKAKELLGRPKDLATVLELKVIREKMK
ncbi:MAG: nucleotidyltransferase [Deltaproteobacteria bacterium]|nr:nucleotidyltransferase [Deltaproteobacteria bacterium]